MAKKEKNTRTGFMDATDFYHEVGCAKGGNVVYPSEKDLLENSPCAKQCGIVKVEILEGELILPTNFEQEDMLSVVDHEEKTPKYFEYQKTWATHYREQAERHKESSERYLALANKIDKELNELKKNNDYN
jgi:hypothetical protein